MAVIETIWKNYSAEMFAFIRKRVSREADAEDILNDVFLKIYNGINGLKDETKIKSWIYRITRNSIIDYYRKDREIMPIESNISLPDEEEGETDRKNLAAGLIPMINALPEPFCEAVFLSEIKGLTQSRVAKIQGIRLSGAKSRIQRGRKMLKKMFTDCCRFEFDVNRQIIGYEKK